MTRDIPLRLHADLADTLGERQWVSASVGPGAQVILLAVGRADVPVVRAHDVQPGWASFPVTRTERPYDAAVLVHDGHEARRIVLRDEDIGHPLVQPLPDGDVLVVGTRCRRFADGTFERNARVYGINGELRRAFLLGDGINDVQASSTGDLWVAYFDEGVFGNYGWGSEPVGSAGLLRFDAHGNKVWQFEPPDGFGPIDDCYALNVEAEAAWAYYYSDFPLVRIGSDGEPRAWRTEVAGAKAFAVGEGRVLFFGGYHPQRDRCTLWELADERLANPIDGRLVTPNGKPLGGDAAVIGRGPVLHAFTATAWYQVDVRDLG